jgi:ankyrin repeat protein
VTDEGTQPDSTILQALYEGRREDAERLAGERGELDVFEAAALGRPERVAALVEEDPGLARAWTPDGFTALHYAGFFGDVESARSLIAGGADVNAIARNASLVVAPIHSAAASRQNETVRVLLDAGADPNARQENGFVALHAAAQHGDRELAELLLERGADPSAATDDGRTAESIARDEGHDELAALVAATLAAGI